MDIAYLILAHNQPAHLRALIERLSTPDSHFYIHIDSKSRLADFSLPSGPRVHVLQKRVPVFWGDYSQVEAIVLLMRAALAQQSPAHARFVLLSGADYPVRSNAFIHRFFLAHANMEFINLTPMPSADGSKPLSRLATYQPRKTASRVINRLKRAAQGVGLLPRQRDFAPALGRLKPHGGSQWWALTRPAVAYVLDFMDTHPAYVDFYRNTVVPDESCFHTILGNSPFAAMAQRSLTYADWGHRRQSPEDLSLAHAEFLTANPSQPPSTDFPQGMPFLFARKFSARSRELLRLLNANLDGKPQTRDSAARAIPANPGASRSRATATHAN